MRLQYIIYFSLLILALVLFLLPIVVMAIKPGLDETVWKQTSFWFRDDDGTETSATGYGSPEDAARKDETISVAPGTVFRLRFGIRATHLDGTIIPCLEFKQGTDCATGSWTAVTSASNTFNLHSSDNFIDGDVTTEQITNGQFLEGQILELTNPASSYLDLPKNKNTEYEWSLQAASNIAAGTTYGFRITNNGTALNDYEQCPSLIIQSEPESESIPSGRGSARPITVIFSGRVFPNAKIFVVDKEVRFERIVDQNIVADENGTFQVSFIGISPGLHSFGLLIKDKDNRATQTKFFNIDVNADDLIVKDILVPPTIGFLQRLISRGQPLIIIGDGSPNNIIIFEIDDIIKKEANVEKDGSYKVAVDTSMLEFGAHRVRVKQIDVSQKRESDYSLTNTFVVSRLVLPKTDLSGDGVINIKDWSMFLSNWGLKDESQKKIIDFNDDGKIDISDFSIFIRTIKNEISI